MKLTKTLPKAIAIKQEVRFGKPTISGTRIAVADILHLLEGGYTLNDIPRQYPGVTVNKAKTVLRYAANILA